MLEESEIQDGAGRLADMQSCAAEVALPIDRVGIKAFRLPLVVRDRDRERQNTVALVDMGVDLPAAFKGTHMSRFVEALEYWREHSSEELDYGSLKRLLEDVLARLDARKAHVSFRFPYFRIKAAPVSGSLAPVSYDCCFTGEMEAGHERPSFLLQIDVPVTTVCPCSKAISRAGAHGQRALVKMWIRMSRFRWMEEFIDLAEAAGSAPIYSLLKRSDEKAVTERAHEDARFVEDVVRLVASRLEELDGITWFRVEVESHESIHSHDAFACIERRPEK